MPRPGYDEVTLLTGFPSFLARKLASHILEHEPKTLIHSVVRAKFAREAEQTVSNWPKDQRERFVMIEGDAAAMDLGLSGVEFRSLTGEVDRIHHAAQVTYLGVDQHTALALNVGGTGEIIEFARAASALKCLILHSTTEVSGYRTGVVWYSRSERAGGKPKQTLVKLLRYGLDAIFSFSYKPLRLSLALGMLVCAQVK